MMEQDVLYLEFGKSNSKFFKRAVNLAKGLPGFTFSDGKYSIKIKDLINYLKHQETIFELLQVIAKWKSTNIYFLGEKYKAPTISYQIGEMLKKKAGKYSPILNNPERLALDGSVTIEPLPLPFVFYPDLYGCFFAFSDDINGTRYFCECEREAIKNCIELNRIKGKDELKRMRRMFPKLKELSTDSISIDSLKFKEGVCFRCNHVVPKKIYCDPMYGGQFKQHYGWYINQEHYKLGIDTDIFGPINALPAVCPPKIYDSIQRANRFLETDTADSQTYLNVEELRKEMDRDIENSVRVQFGFKKIGEAWVSETLLYKIVQGLYPKQKILRHYRPKWLEGLELDIYIPDLKLGFEYQGIQHFKAVNHWGGKEQLKKQQEHDMRKRELCEKLGINLIYINYYEPLDSEFVSSRIAESLQS